MPVTISAFIMGILVIPMIKALLLLLSPISPTQVRVPMIVATTVDIRAIISVFARALSILSSPKRFIYHLNVNPPHLALDLLPLKESTISVAIGAYMKTRIIPI